MKYLFLFLLLPLTSQAQDTARLKTPLFDNWSFQKGTRPDPRKWDAVHPPHTWNKFDLSDDEPGYYRGPAWYRCILNWDNLPQKERAFIYFEAAFQHAEVWVNGKQAGSHKGGYTAFCLDITELVSRQSDTILVRLDNSPDPLIPPLKGGVNFYGGLFRDVWLLQTSGVHIDLLDHGGPGVYITTPEIDIERGTVEIRGTLVNHNGHTTRKRLRAHILDASGKEMVGTQKGINIPPGQTAFRLNLA
ncbi:MAG: beta-galactosidase, partial [Bacteroidetes bacterium]